MFGSWRRDRTTPAPAGEPYKDKLSLPGFLTKGRSGHAGRDEIRAGLTLTGYFLQSRVLAPRGETLPDVLSRLNDVLAR